MPWYIRILLLAFPPILIGYCYAAWRVTRALTVLNLSSGKKTRYYAGLIVLFFNSLPILFLVFYFAGFQYQSFFRKDHLSWVDFIFVFPCWLGIIILNEALPYFLTIDLVAVIIRLFKPVSQVRWQKWLAALQLSILVCFFFLVGLRAYADTYYIRNRSLQVRLENLPPELENLKLTLVADIQVDRFTRGIKLSRLRQKLRSPKSDLLLFGGDLVTYGSNFIQEGVNILCETPVSVERIACLGDHDFWVNPAKISRGLRRCGWVFLKNQHHPVKYKGRKILITGLTHIYSKPISQGQLRSLLQTAPPADLKILLVHQPSPHILRAAARNGYTLLLAGHTHGGQIVFKPFGIPITPSQFENEFYTGHNIYQGLHVIITNGIGLTFAPWRYHAPAEVTRIVIIRKPE